ncbi:MAG: hypothetical protein JNL70_22180 [Saprospiraceae bacterium]|nr:hypothetical protein [Saprospiraceae bacterium]
MRAFSFLVLLFSFSALSYAQKPLPSKGDDDSLPSFTVARKDTWLHRFEKRQQKTVELLGLTEPQKRSLDVLNDNYVTQRANLQEDKTLNLQSRQAKIETLRRERETKFKNILTVTQLAKWNELRKLQKKKTFRKK